MQNSNVKTKLIILSFMQFAIWGAYLTSMGRYLDGVGMGADIAWFYSVQGIVSIFMPAIIGIIADRWVPAQRMLSFCHAVAAIFMAITGFVGMSKGSSGVGFNDLFWTYTISVAFYMPTLALSNSVSYTVLTKAGLDTVKAFPPIRVFGTVGFIASMWLVDLTGFQNDYSQFLTSAVWGALLAVYSLTLPKCPVNKGGEKKSLAAAFGLDAFKLFNKRKMAMFFIFSMLLGAALQVSNGFASPFINSFAADSTLANTFAVEHTNMLISLSQISETLCILLIPFFLRKFGIKTVMFIAMLGWVFRFGFFAVGDPGMPGVIFFVLSMIVYGVAFDFFNISGSLFVDKEVPESMRSSAQGLFMLMTNGLGASIGVIAAQKVVDAHTTSLMLVKDGKEVFYTVGDWPTAWYIFAGYALVIALLFWVVFKDKKESKA